MVSQVTPRPREFTSLGGSPMCLWSDSSSLESWPGSLEPSPHYHYPLRPSLRASPMRPAAVAPIVWSWSTPAVLVASSWPPSRLDSLLPGVQRNCVLLNPSGPLRTRWGVQNARDVLPQGSPLPVNVQESQNICTVFILFLKTLYTSY